MRHTTQNNKAESGGERLGNKKLDCEKKDLIECDFQCLRHMEFKLGNNKGTKRNRRLKDSLFLFFSHFSFDSLIQTESNEIFRRTGKWQAAKNSVYANEQTTREW
jgi:hypothetical protein